MAPGKNEKFHAPPHLPGGLNKFTVNQSMKITTLIEQLNGPFYALS